MENKLLDAESGIKSELESIVSQYSSQERFLAYNLRLQNTVRFREKIYWGVYFDLTNGSTMHLVFQYYPKEGRYAIKGMDSERQTLKREEAFEMLGQEIQTLQNNNS